MIIEANLVLFKYLTIDNVVSVSSFIFDKLSNLTKKINTLCYPEGSMAGICWLWPDQCMFRPKICLDLSYKIFFQTRQGQASFFTLCKIIITSVMPMVGVYTI